MLKRTYIQFQILAVICLTAVSGNVLYVHAAPQEDYADYDGVVIENGEYGKRIDVNNKLSQSGNSVRKNENILAVERGFPVSPQGDFAQLENVSKKSSLIGEGYRKAGNAGNKHRVELDDRVHGLDYRNEGNKQRAAYDRRVKRENKSDIR